MALCDRFDKGTQKYAGERFFEPQPNWCAAIVLGVFAGISMAAIIILLAMAAGYW